MLHRNTCENQTIITFLAIKMSSRPMHVLKCWTEVVTRRILIFPHVHITKTFSCHVPEFLERTWKVSVVIQRCLLMNSTGIILSRCDLFGKKNRLVVCFDCFTNNLRLSAIKPFFTIYFVHASATLVSFAAVFGERCVTSQKTAAKETSATLA